MGYLFILTTKERRWIISLGAKSWKLGAMLFDICNWHKYLQQPRPLDSEATRYVKLYSAVLYG